MTSRDRVTWDLQWSGYSGGTTTALQTFDTMDASARYVRYVGSGAIANGTSESILWNSVTEMEVFAAGSP